jgi:hypothetical protein
MTYEKLNLQLLFQLAYLEPESRLCNPQNLSSFCEALLFAHSNEIRQFPNIHALLMASQIVMATGCGDYCIEAAISRWSDLFELHVMADIVIRMRVCIHSPNSLPAAITF